MKKNLSLWMLGIAAMLASCSQNEELAQGADGQKNVTIAVNLEDAGSYARSRAFTPNTAEADANVTRCYMEVIEKGVSTRLVLMDGDQTSGFTATLALDPANDYKFLFWADGGTGCYTITDEAGKRLQEIAVADGAAVSVAYQDAVDWDKGSAVEATLTHAVAKVSVRTTTDLDGGTLTLTVPTYTGYNVGGDTDKLVGDETSQDYSITLTDPITVTDADAGALVFSCYVLYDGTKNLNLTYGKTPDAMCPATIYNVPLKPNQHTVLLGDIANLGLSSVSVTASISSSWEDGGTSQFPQAATADGDTHTIVTGVAGQITTDPSLITTAMNGSGIIKVIGPMNQADMDAIIANKDDISVLDLSGATGKIANTRSAFLKSASLTKVKLGSNVTSIDGNAFFGCENLAEVDLSECTNLERIEDQTFGGSGITSLKLPENGKLYFIGGYAFTYTKIQTVSIPATIESLSGGIFLNCDLLTQIIFQGTETPTMADGYDSFADCIDANTNNDKTIYLPNVAVATEAWTDFFGQANGWAIEYGKSPEAANP